MSTVMEIEAAISRLTESEKLRLLDFIGRTVAREQTLKPSNAPGFNKSHGVLEIPVVSVGSILQPEFKRAELLDEMLEERL